MNKISKRVLVTIGILTIVFTMGLGHTPANAATKSITGKTIKITAKDFEFSPNVIILSKRVPVTLKLTTLDVRHGFNCPGLNIRCDVVPGKVSTLKVTPQKAGSFPFFCDVYCGEGHEGMNGKIIVK